MAREPLDCAAADDLAAGFVLGALDPDDEAAVRAHLVDCAQPHPLFAELGGVVPYLALDVAPIEPRSALRTQLRAAVDGEGAVASSHREARPQGESMRRSEGRGPLRRRWSAGRWGVGILAAALIVALGGTSAFLAARLGDTQAYADHLARTATLAAQPGSRALAVRSSGEAGPSGTAVLPPTGDGTIVVEGLASVSGAEVYEVWLIAGSGSPIPAGQLHLTSDGRGWLDGLGAAPPGPVTVAITREAGPGAKTPTLPILASGSTS